MSGSNSDEIKRPSVSLPAPMNEEIESQLDYGDSKSEFIREAVREKLDRDANTDE